MAAEKPRTNEADEWMKAAKGVIPSYSYSAYPYGSPEEEQS